MFASDNVNSSTCVIRIYIYRAMCIVCRHFVTYGPHCRATCSFYINQKNVAFVLILYGHIVHVLLSGKK